MHRYRVMGAPQRAAYLRQSLRWWLLPPAPIWLERVITETETTLTGRDASNESPGQ
jgi:hypothetical protein